jgi:hypothetical protein
VHPTLQGLQGFTGAIAVGGLTSTSLFLLAAVFAPNLLPAIDVVTRSTAWAVVAAIPLTALSYVLGLLTIASAQSLIIRGKLVSLANLAAELQAVASLGELVTASYQQQRQEAEVLAGSSLAFLVLSIACVIAAFGDDGWRRTLLAVAVACLLVSIGSVLLAIGRFRGAASLAQANSHSKAET